MKVAQIVKKRKLLSITDEVPSERVIVKTILSLIKILLSGKSKPRDCHGILEYIFVVVC